MKYSEINYQNWFNDTNSFIKRVKLVDTNV